MATDTIIDDGKGGELLEVTESHTLTKDTLQAQKDAIAAWRVEEDSRHATKLTELDAREAIINERIAMFKA